MKRDVARTNQATWFAREVALEYARERKPFPAEAAVLDYRKEEIAQARLLDIGVGAGRTTAFLPSACRAYIGIDYSKAMLDIARERYPRVDLRERDARDLSEFLDGSFEVVWFSYNGIDYVSHEDRLKILGEIRRVLKPRGLFVFSSHNRDSRIYPAYHPRNLQLTINPIRLAKRCLHYLSGIVNSAKLASQEVRTESYAIVNDPAHGYNMLTYYISTQKQAEQLRDLGFEIESVWGINGEKLTDGEVYAEGYTVHYVARSTGAGSISIRSAASASE